MKAALLHKIGDISELNQNLRIEDFPVPQISNEEVLVKIKSASLNHRDLWIAKGLYSKIKLPVILGSDCSGIIEKKGSNAPGISGNDEVIINPSLDWGDSEDHQSTSFKILGLPDDGTFAEFIKINSSYIYPKPPHLNFELASALALAGLTAYRACFVKAKIKPGDNVLITGIGGGVASMALQFSLAAGANVYVTSGGREKIDKAVALGAKDGVSYRDEGWGERIKEITEGKIDVVLDSSGGETIASAVDFCSYGSRIVTYGATNGTVKDFDIRRVYWKQISLLGSTMGSGKDFADMLDFVNEHKIIPIVDKAYPFDKIHSAFERMNAAEQFGKIVINIA